MSLVLAAVLPATVGCGAFDQADSGASDDVAPPVLGPHSAGIDAHFAALSPSLTRAPARREGPPGPDFGSGDYVCRTVHIDHTRPYESFVPYDGDLLWPGAILQGDALDTGTFSPVEIDRQGLHISLAVAGAGARVSVATRSASPSSVHAAVGELLAARPVAPAKAATDAEIEEVDSRDQLALALGARSSWSGAAARLARAFDFDDRTIRSRFVVRYSKTLYTVDVDAPKTASQFFAPAVDVAEVRTKFPLGTGPSYVSSIAYGHMVVLAIESPFSAEEMWAALSFAFKGAPELSGQFSLTHEERISGSRVTAYALGGSESGTAVTDFAAMRDVMQTTGTFTRESPAVPTAYSLRDVRDGSVRSMTLTEGFDVKTCERVNQRVRLTFSDVTGNGGEGESPFLIYGTVSGHSEIDAVVLFSRSSSECVAVPPAQVPSQTQLGAGVLNIVPRAGNPIVLDVDLWSRSSLGDERLGEPANRQKALLFEDGWRGTRTMSLQTNGGTATVHLALRPL
jgi:hypothetical protein